MSKLIPGIASVVLLVIASMACSSTGVSTPDPNLINVAVAQTLSAIQTQTAQFIIPNAGATPTPTSTFTPPAPTSSPTITLSPTPIFTSTPLVPLISVSVPTNCRVGPGKVFDRVGALLVGQVTEVIGRDLVGNYWYVRNPDDSNGFCWLWGEYATLSGNIQVLPIFTPPPTPTPVPAFVASYSSLESCNNTWWVEIKLENTGGITFKSILMSVADSATNTTVSISDNKFTNVNGCNTSDTRNTLVAGDKLIESSMVFSYDPSGHKLRATITLCSEVGVNGTCVTQVIEFKP
jgi:hypothetical protein